MICMNINGFMVLSMPTNKDKDLFYIGLLHALAK